MKQLLSIFTLLLAFPGAAIFLFSPGYCQALASDIGLMQLKVSNLNPRSAMVPEFTLNRKTGNRLKELPAMTAGINSEAGAVDRVVLDEEIPGVKSYNPELPVIIRDLPPGDYYLYVQMEGFETSLDFSILTGKTTVVHLVLSHIELRVPQCGFYDSESVEFHVFLPQGPPIYRDQVLCDSRRIISLEPGAYEGVVIDEDQKRRIFPFVIKKGKITPVEFSFP